MKVYIGPYKSWFGPYQLAEKILFWMDSNEDDRVHSFGHFLDVGTFDVEDTGTQTILSKILYWIYSKQKRTIKVSIDRYDTWGMNETLAIIILPMLKQLKDTKHGAPYVDITDVPAFLRPSEAEIAEYNKDGSTDDNFFKRWDYVMDEMIFAFEMKNKDDWMDEFRSGEMGKLKFKKLEDPLYTDLDTGKEECLYEIIEDPNSTYKVDYEAVKKVQERISNGFRLFGKYYEGLWD